MSVHSSFRTWSSRQLKSGPCSRSDEGNSLGWLERGETHPFHLAKLTGFAKRSTHAARLGSRRPQRYISRAGSRRLPDVEFKQLRCDIMILGDGHAAAGVIVVVNSAGMAIEAALGDDRRAEEIIRAKVGQ